MSAPNPKPVVGHAGYRVEVGQDKDKGQKWLVEVYKGDDVVDGGSGFATEKEAKAEGQNLIEDNESTDGED